MRIGRQEAQEQRTRLSMSSKKGYNPYLERQTDFNRSEKLEDDNIFSPNHTPNASTQHRVIYNSSDKRKDNNDNDG
jgi:hypothetical protein